MLRTKMVVSLRLKVFFAMLFVAMVVTAALMVTGYYQKREALLGDFQAISRSIASTAALQIPGELVDLIQTNDDRDDAAFREVRDYLEKVRAANQLSFEEIYILRPLPAPEGEAEFVVMLNSTTFIGNRYQIRPENLGAWREALTSGRTTTTGIYQDQHGSWISAYAPVCDMSGKTCAVLEVDARLDRYLSELNQQMSVFALAGIFSFGLAMVPGLLLAGHVTRSIRDLSNGLVRFRQGDATVQVMVRSGDELDTLANSFNEMIQVWRERVALLPFVSKFTADAIRRARQDQSILMGRQQEMFVLFADLRGFTRFSQHQKASDLIQKLNHLLAIKADTVIMAGGDIDKFIGDALMAIFSPGPGQAERAVHCAQALLRNIRQEIDRHGWDLGIGVGLHFGPAVLGAVGSDVRRDFTAIGHTVNVASRLCSNAVAWELLISDDVFAQLPPVDAQGFAGPEDIQVKNVQAPLPIFRYRLLEPAVASGAPAR